MPDIEQKPKGKYYKATLPRRYFAIVIDAMIIFIPSFLAQLFFDLFGSLLGIVLSIGYPIFFTWKYGATLGKQLLKIKVVTTQYQPVSLTQALLRESVGKFLSGIVLNLGFLWAIWDKDWQTWHDKIAKTYVVTEIPNNGKHTIWVYIGLIIYIILSILAVFGLILAVILVAVNPYRQFVNARDTVRLHDMTTVAKAIDLRLTQPATITDLCAGKLPPCFGSSDESGAEKIDGSGWVKLDLTDMIVRLPLDPKDKEKNTTPFIYRYCATSDGWEINAKFETEIKDMPQTNPKLAEVLNQDNGDNQEIFEIGTDLTACSQAP